MVNKDDFLLTQRDTKACFQVLLCEALLEGRTRVPGLPGPLKNCCILAAAKSQGIWQEQSPQFTQTVRNAHNIHEELFQQVQVVWRQAFSSDLT